MKSKRNRLVGQTKKIEITINNGYPQVVFKGDIQAADITSTINILLNYRNVNNSRGHNRDIVDTIDIPVN